jgi:adenylyltransferase/sulfurtransferase
MFTREITWKSSGGREGLNKMGRANEFPDDYLERYRSQIAVIGKKGQQKLKKTRVHIAGLGGIGNLLALFLSTLGVGHISANDPQRLETENLGRFVCGEEADIGRDKVIAAARFFHRNRLLEFEPVVGKNESASVDSLFERADWIFSCANTVPARVAAARKAVELRKPIIDAGVSDGKVSLAGSIKYWLPGCADWSACPACYLVPRAEIPRNEGLLFTVLAKTAALAAQVFVSLALGIGADFLKRRNHIIVDLDQFRIESIAVVRREQCTICSNCSHYRANSDKRVKPLPSRTDH